jgi:UDP-N-acetylmuramyl pentapeptide phosphotransferase/UDP-N-acetylglucosamine-1-phosphate transferase
MIFFYLVILTIFILFINKFLIQKDILISETGDIHQKFASKSSVPLTGGLFIFLGFEKGFQIFLPEDIFFKNIFRKLN